MSSILATCNCYLSWVHCLVASVGVQLSIQTLNPSRFLAQRTTSFVLVVYCVGIPIALT